MKKLLVICGPTATGKTDLAAALARKYRGVLISADSRQVYKDLNIGTGKEWPSGVKVLGYDLVGPRDEFSVSDFIRFTGEAVQEVWSKHLLPILVGGTGFYIKAVIDGVDTSIIPKNAKLRNILEKFDKEELYDKLAQLDPLRAASMNASDKKNPRRLVRAIEIAQTNLSGVVSNSGKSFAVESDILMVGLTANKGKQISLIKSRVQSRLKMGIEREIKALLDNNISWEDQSMASIGYREWREYFEGGKTRADVTSDWIKDEVSYAKRQMVWFKKDKRIKWFDVSNAGYDKNIENLVRTWYSQTTDGKES